MPTAEGFVSTDRADRYLSQLSRHLGHGPAGIQADTRTDGSLFLDLGDATCVLSATPVGLRLQAESSAADQLAQLQRRLAGRIEQIGHRDSLTVHWNPPPPPANAAERHTPSSHA
jgi:hypothetical protein